MDRPSRSRGRQSHAPWLRNERWSSGSIRDQSPENLLAVWVFTILWNLITLLALIPHVKNAIHAHDKLWLLATAFPAIGLALIVWARRRTRRITQFGPSVFRLQTLPASPGGDLAGTVHVARNFKAQSPIQLKLVCINRYLTGVGRNARVLDHQVWQEIQTLDLLPPCEDGTEIPVLFHLPPDAPTSSDLDFGDGFRWRLEVRCKTTGVRYYSRFEVPVFVVASSSPFAAPKARVFAAPPRSSDLSDPRSKLAENGITCERINAGRLRVSFAAARNRSSAIRITVTGLVLTAIAIGLANWPDVILDRVIMLSFAASSLLVGGVFCFIAILRWLATAEITVRYGSLTVQRRTFLFRQEQTFKLADVSDIFPKNQGASSSKPKPDTANTKTFYNLLLKTRDGDFVRLANDITQKDYAAFLADEIKDTLGVVPAS